MRITTMTLLLLLSGCSDSEQMMNDPSGFAGSSADDGRVVLVEHPDAGDVDVLPVDRDASSTAERDAMSPDVVRDASPLQPDDAKPVGSDSGQDAAPVEPEDAGAPDSGQDAAQDAASADAGDGGQDAEPPDSGPSGPVVVASYTWSTLEPSLPVMKREGEMVFVLCAGSFDCPPSDPSRMASGVDASWDMSSPQLQIIEEWADSNAELTSAIGVAFGTPALNQGLDVSLAVPSFYEAALEHDLVRIDLDVEEFLEAGEEIRFSVTWRAYATP